MAYIQTCIHIYVLPCVRMYMCMNVYIHVYICIYIMEKAKKFLASTSVKKYV